MKMDKTMMKIMKIISRIGEIDSSSSLSSSRGNRVIGGKLRWGMLGGGIIVYWGMFLLGR
jgi:hypothetical protein